MQWVGSILAFDCPRWWPLSIFNPRTPSPQDLLVALATLAVGLGGIRWIAQRGFRTAETATLALLLVLGTNAAQGVPRGFVNPIAGGIRQGAQYYHDALSVDSATAFLQTFHQRQPHLLEHGRTHPPGAVLLFHGLRRMTGDQPALAALLITVAATALSAWSFRRFASGLLEDEELSRYGSLLYLVLPAVQIYYCATLDALICSLLLGAFALWSGTPANPGRTLCATGLLIAASFLTFGFVWALPALALLALRRRRTLRQMGVLMGGFLLFYTALYAAFGFSYPLALQTASRLENPQGFRLFAEPVSYLFTRLEDVAELLVFFGPFLTLLAARGLRPLQAKYPDAFLLMATATGTLLALFLTGAYRTGETARACLFLYPFLLLPVLALLKEATHRERQMLLTLVFLQALGMQLFGNYFW